MTVVERLQAEDARELASWDAFVLANPQATFFHRAGWLKILRDVLHHDTYYLLARTQGRITGVLPLAHVKSRLFGNALTSLPFAAYAGVAADDGAPCGMPGARSRRTVAQPPATTVTGIGEAVLHVQPSGNSSASSPAWS